MSLFRSIICLLDPAIYSNSFVKVLLKLFTGDECLNSCYGETSMYADKDEKTVFPSLQHISLLIRGDSVSLVIPHDL